jgi:hypothetical protein
MAEPLYESVHIYIHISQNQYVKHGCDISLRATGKTGTRTIRKNWAVGTVPDRLRVTSSRLIPGRGAACDTSDPDRIARFSDIIFEAGIPAPVRTPRGRDTMAACGQLKSAAEKKSRAELDRLAEEKQAALG